VPAGMPPLTWDTEQRLALLFPEAQRDTVRATFRDTCGSPLPHAGTQGSVLMERIHFAVLKLSEGELPKLDRAAALAKLDWRDLLVVAGFGEDTEAHRRWMPTEAGKS